MPTAHITQTGILDLIFQAGIVAKFVLLLLLGASIFCWAVIVTKWKTLHVALQQNEKFMEVFWSGKNLDEVMTKCEKFPHSPIASVFKSSVKELRKLSSSDIALQSSEK